MPTALQGMPPRLNLPAAPLQMRAGRSGVEVWDSLRRQWLVLTAEEWVRQHFVHYLCGSKGCREAFMANEVSISLNGLSRRCDTVVYSPSLKPLAIVEYKAAGVAVTRRALDQVLRYNVVMRVPYLIVSNGLRHCCYRVHPGGQGGGDRGVALDHVPSYAEMLEGAVGGEL